VLVDYMGHPSARVPGTDRIVTKPRHSETVRGMDQLSAEQMIVMDLDRNLLGGSRSGGQGALHSHADELEISTVVLILKACRFGLKAPESCRLPKICCQFAAKSIGDSG
jgi:hypothetical protein